MVARCKKVNVDIYVDAIINHMSGVGSGKGIGGSEYTEYSYPGVPFGRSDFHFCGTKDNDITNYRDAFEVRNCELVNLADLATEKESVRDKIAGYLNDLTAMGVAGFRFDAAKHMEPKDLSAIMKKVKGDPYVFQEVIEDPSEPIKASEYFGIGDVTEFNYGKKVAEHFKDKGKIKYLETFGAKFGLVPSDKAVVFTSNHDNERGHGGGGSVLTFRDGKVAEIADVFMLAWPYGYPKVMSSYGFKDTDAGPPSSSPYQGSKVVCGFNEAWKCQHRWSPIANMVAFRNAAADKFEVTDWSSKGDVISFGRSNRGFVVINREDFEVTETFKTSMSRGTYCNVITGELKDGKCTGGVIVVGSDGKMQVTIPALSAAVIHIDAVQGAQTTAPQANTTLTPKSGPGSYESVYSQMFLRGTFNQWKTGSMMLTADNTWTLDMVSFAGNENARFKFDTEGDWSLNFGDNGSDGIADKNGDDIPVCPSVDPFTITFNDRTKKYSVTPSANRSDTKDELRR